MGMAVGEKGGVNLDINVTPLIDVVLVLLIIFMVLTPLMQKAHQVNLPAPAAPADALTHPQHPDTQLILSVDKDKTIHLNQETVDIKDLARRVTEILGTKSDKVLFFRADAAISYRDVMNIIDVCRGAGVRKVGIITEDLKKATEEAVSEEVPADALPPPPPPA